MMSEKDHTNPLAPLEPWLNDPEVLEIMVNGYDSVYVERKGELVEAPTPFRDEEHLMEVIKAILTPLGKKVSPSTPMVDARLFDGSRVNIVIPPISLTGPTLVIRKLDPSPITFEDLYRYGSVSKEIVEFLRACVQGRLNIIVAGGTASGKTTFLNMVAEMIPPDERIIVVQNVSELQLSQKHLVILETRPPNLEGRGEVSTRDLVLNALKMRPDRIILSEVMEADAAFVLFDAMTRGHDGNLLTMHANSPHDALTRLEMMATATNPSLPLLNVRQQMAAALNLIVHIGQLRDGSRKVLKVTEMVGMQGDVIILQDIFEFRQTGIKEGKISGYFTATGHIPKYLERVRAAGAELPLSLFTPQ
jgi:pilus assembly protein CpaF